LLDEPLHINNFMPWAGRISSITVSPGIDWEHIALKKLDVKTSKSREK